MKYILLPAEYSLFQYPCPVLLLLGATSTGIALVSRRVHLDFTAINFVLIAWKNIMPYWTMQHKIKFCVASSNRA